MSINKTQFVTPTQLAKMLGISRVAIHQKIKKGEIKAENVGDSVKPTYLIFELRNAPTSLLAFNANMPQFSEFSIFHIF